MTTQAQTKEIMTFDKYEIHVRELNNSRFNYAVQLRQLTPKAKYSPYKSIFNYGFNSYLDAINYANNYKEREVNRLEERKVERVKRAQENKVDAKDFYKIGDIVVNSWGYEQTNIDFYQVVDITARTIKIKSIHCETVKDSLESNGMSCLVVALKNEFEEDGEEYKLIVKKEGRLSNPERFYYFQKWDGRPEYKSWYA
jgi:hypothetical protein